MSRKCAEIFSSRSTFAPRAASMLLWTEEMSQVNMSGHPGRSAQKKGYIGSVSTKTHSGGSDGTGGFGGFLGSGRFLALKFGFYEEFHRQNWLEIGGKQDYAKN